MHGYVAQGLEHVATNYGVGGSNPSLPKFSNFVQMMCMGYSQVVRQWTLTPSFGGSTPPIPDLIRIDRFDSIFSIF